MIGRAACRGAATIVNAIATGKGAAFGITLEADAEVTVNDAAEGFMVQAPEEGHRLAQGCVRAVAARAGKKAQGGIIRIESDIPVSRGLKSSSAVSNALVLACAGALGVDLSDQEALDIGIDESVKAGITITGAFDDAAACLMGGVVVTDNGERKVLRTGRLDPGLVVIMHVPDRRISKQSVKSLDFGPIRQEVEHAFALAMKGEYAKALELNSRAYAKVLDVSEEAAEAARLKGALAAGISGTGPATVALARPSDADAVTDAFKAFEGRVLRAGINDTPARKVVPRLL